VTPVLMQATGVFIAGIQSERLIEMDVKTWEAVAKRLGGWKKHSSKRGLINGCDPNGREGDDVDAEYIGWTAICFALGYNQKDKEKDREPALAATKERM